MEALCLNRFVVKINMYTRELKYLFYGLQRVSLFVNREHWTPNPFFCPCQQIKRSTAIKQPMDILIPIVLQALMTSTIAVATT